MKFAFAKVDDPELIADVLNRAVMAIMTRRPSAIKVIFYCKIRSVLLQLRA